MTVEQQQWTVPPELAAFDQFTNYPARAEELINSPESVFANAVKAVMRAEVSAQWALLARLYQAGLLKIPSRT
jgi:hypothetical protein